MASTIKSDHVLSDYHYGKLRLLKASPTGNAQTSHSHSAGLGIVFIMFENLEKTRDQEVTNSNSPKETPAVTKNYGTSERVIQNETTFL